MNNYMKKYIVGGFILCCIGFIACNSNTQRTSDPVERADSVNEAQNEMISDATDAREATSDFLVKAADCGMAEVAAGKIARDKSVNTDVKAFAAEMIKEHEAVNKEVKSLASRLNIELPATSGEDHQKKIAELGGKEVKNFDKAFMDMMISDHKKTLDLFKDAGEKTLDPDVKAFIIATIPTLESHLARAETVQKTLP